MKTSYRSSGVLPLNARFSFVLRCCALISAALGPIVELQAQSNYETPYIFTTLAGSPAGGSTDGAGSAARFYLPKGIAVDASGNSYVADTTNHTIRKITVAGVVTTLAGIPGSRGATDGTGTAARFYSPAGVAVDASGNIFVADTNNHTIRKITPAGVVTTFAGAANQAGSADGTGSLARFSAPIGIAVDAAGNVYIGDTSNHTIRKITSLGVVTTLAGSAGVRNSTDGAGSMARFDVPQNLTVDGSGNVYVADSNNNTVRKITPAGLVSTLAGAAGTNGSIDGTGSAARFYYPTGVASDAAGNVYVADYRNCTIRQITPAGVVTTIAGIALNIGSTDGTSTDARFNSPTGLAVDGVGNLYVADTYNNVIRKITQGGEVSTFAGTALTTGSNDGTSSTAKFYYPAGVAADGSGNVYVADTSNSTIRKIDSEGVVTTLAGTAYNYGSADGTGSAASFNLPQSVAVDSEGNVYVADFLNCTIRKISPGSAVTTLAGSAGVFGSTNGPGVYARFSYVNGVAVDSSGNVYVADTYNSMIRKITPAGVVTTLADSRDLSLPFDVAVDGLGNVFVANTTGQTIRKITATGVVTTLAGSAGVIGSADGAGSAARFNNPRGIVADASGNVFVTDENHTIRRITSAGVVTTIAGTAGQSGTSDGTGSAALFNFPRGLAVDEAGNLYVADYYNHTIRKGTPTVFAPIITTQPVGQAVTAGSNVTLHVSASGGPPPSYQWRKNGVDIAGANSTSLVLTNLLPGDAGSYDVLVSNSQGSTASAAAIVTVDGFPVIANLSVPHQQLAPGQTLNLSVSATGTGTLSYQWIHNGGVITGATSAAFSAANLTVSGGGWYEVLITDTVGTTRSPLMFVTVLPPVTQVLGWGYNGYHQIDIPTGLNDAIAIATGYNFSLALKANGTVVAWGTGSNGETNIPAGLTGVVAVAADRGGGHVLALKSDGTVVAWGNNVYGQCNIPSGLKYVAAIGVGSTYSVALRTDGTLVIWGTAPNSLGTSAAGLSGVVAISSSNNHLLALKSDGTVAALGSNSYGESTTPVGLTNVIGVAAGRNHSLALKNDGTVIAWGWNYALYGQTIIPAGLSGVAAIAAGADFSMAIKNDGTLVAWGDNGYGQRNIPTDLSDVLAVSGSDQFTLALRDTSDDTVPAITSQPVGLTVLENLPVTFSVTAAGKGPISYQWRKGGMNIVGATASTFTLAKALPSDAGSYDVVATNHVGSTISTAATLLVTPLPVVTSLSPTRQVLNPGQGLNLSVTATGNGPLSYQWIHNGVQINGATGNGYSVGSVTSQNSGWYGALITDSFGTRRSAPIFVAVAPSRTQLRNWGIGGEISNNVLTNLTDLIAIDAGTNDAVGLKRDGSVISWGYHGDGYVTTTLGYSNVVAVASGVTHALALKSDGTVVAWGSNGSGESSVPAGLTDVVAIAAGYSYSLALKSDGTVVGWGDDSGGATEIPANLTGVVAIDAGYLLPLALKGDGSAISWGLYGNRIPNSISDLVAISTDAFGGSLIGLKNDGTVVTWPYNSDASAGLANMTAVSIGYDFSLALKSNGSVVGWVQWGGNTYGQATPPSDLVNVWAISASYYHAWVLRDGSNDTSPIFATSPISQTVGEEQTVTFTAAATGPGPITYQWRKGGNNIVGATSTSLTLKNLPFSAAGSYDVVATNYIGSTTSTAASLTISQIPTVTNLSQNRQVLVPGQSLNLSVTATGTGNLGYQWTHNGKQINGATSSSYSVARATSTDSGWYVALVTDNNGTRRSAPMFVSAMPALTKIRVWGYDGTDEVNVPQGLNTVIALSHCASDSHSMALKRDGTVVCWGRDYNGDTNPPTDLGSVVAIASGEGHSLALKSDGTVIAWGDNFYGQTNVPAGLKNVVALAAGGFQSLALRSDGTVVSWGSGFYGAADVPEGLSDVVAIAAGDYHLLALKADGTIVTWGSSLYDVGVIPSGLAGVVGIAGGEYHSLAVKMDGTVSAWGYNLDGQTSLPVGLSDVVAVAAGSNHSIALRGNGTVVGWGNNTYGQCTAPSDLSKPLAVAAGYYLSLALCDASAPVAPSTSSDFNGDGKSDILFSNTVTGDRAMWFMDGTAIGTNAFAGTVPTNWVVSGTGDLDGDGKADIFWTNTTTGDRAAWLMNGNIPSMGGYLGAIPVEWVVSGSGDFNGDGKSDIVWTNTTTGERSMWLMNGLTASGGASLGVVPVAWTISGTGDFNGDGKADILLSNTSTGDRVIWFMNGATISTNAFAGTVPPAWLVSGVGDFDGDGKADIFWTNSTTGDRAAWLMNGNIPSMGGYLGAIPVEWVVSATGDYNGDGKADVLWTNTATGERSMWLMNGLTASGGASLGMVPLAWLIN